MELLIKVIDGQIFDHPVTRTNLNYVYGMEIPPEYILFNRTPQPVAGVYEVVSVESIYTYDAETNSVNESWNIRSMTDEEKKEKQDRIKNVFFDEIHPTHTWTSWTLDEEECVMKAPVPTPRLEFVDTDQGIGYNWIEGRGWIKHKTNPETHAFEPIE